MSTVPESGQLECSLKCEEGQEGMCVCLFFMVPWRFSRFSWFVVWRKSSLVGTQGTSCPLIINIIMPGWSQISQILREIPSQGDRHMYIHSGLYSKAFWNMECVFLQKSDTKRNGYFPMVINQVCVWDPNVSPHTKRGWTCRWVLQGSD